MSPTTTGRSHTCDTNCRTCQKKRSDTTTVLTHRKRKKVSGLKKHCETLAPPPDIAGETRTQTLKKISRMKKNLGGRSVSCCLHQMCEGGKHLIEHFIRRRRRRKRVDLRKEMEFGWKDTATKRFFLKRPRNGGTQCVYLPKRALGMGTFLEVLIPLFLAVLDDF